MKRLVKLLIEEVGVRQTPSLYISILLAYIEVFNWDEAEKTLQIFDALDLQTEERHAFLYLKDLTLAQDKETIKELFTYLHM